MVVLKSLIFIVIAPGSVTILVPYILLNLFGEVFPVNIGRFRLGEAIFFATLLLLGYMVFFFFCFYLFAVIYEEPTLRRIFGEAYQEYCHTVPRWIPYHCFPRKRA